MNSTTMKPGNHKSEKCADCKHPLRTEATRQSFGGVRYCLKCWHKRIKPGPAYAMAE